MKIYVGTDHNGFQLKQKLVDHLKQSGHQVVDAGDERLDPNDDFPVFAEKAVTAMLASDEPDPRGILICGSGQGMCMAANRFKGIRAALLYDRESAHASRNDDNSNIACLPAKVLDDAEAGLIIDTWLNTPFASAERFNRRLKELDEMN